jgi:GT2 family glycosyltransferase
VGPEEREDPTCGIMAASPLSYAAPLPGPALLGFLAGATMIRRSAFLAVGGFEPRFFLGGEESLVALDLVAAGWALAYVDSIVIHHFPSPQRDAVARRRLLHRNALWLAWLRRPLRSALRETGRLIRTTVLQPHLAPGFIQGLAGIRWVAQNRRVLPAFVETALRQLERG